MKKRFLILILVNIIFCQIGKTQTINKDSLDIFTKKLMLDFDIPGLAIGIVKSDTVYYANAYGIIDSNNQKEIDINTNFGIGSITKSFTALSLAILVNKEKISWDDKVIEYLPDFKLYNENVTRNFTIKDLLTHRSGLGSVSGGILWYHSDYTREEIIEKVAYLKPISDFRYNPAYQNIMYMIAGEIVAKVSGTSWDNFIQKEILEKLNMNRTTSLSKIRDSLPNTALPYIYNRDFQKIPITQEKGDNIAPAGFIYSNVSDMMNYMQFLLNEGVYNSNTIIKQEVLKELFTPQIIFPTLPTHNKFTSYGLGWWLTPERNYTIIEHSGGIDGMTSNLIMIPELDFGVIVLTNTDEMAAIVLTDYVVSKFINNKNYDIYDKALRYRDYLLNNKKINNDTIQNNYKKAIPSFDLEKYTGSYYDPAYGNIYVSLEADKQLKINFSHSNIFTANLYCWENNKFLIKWDDIRIPYGFAIFTTDINNKIIGIDLQQPNLLDVNFGELEIIRK